MAIRSPFEKLVRLYEKRVFSLTSRMCRNSADAEEAAPGGVFGRMAGLPAFRGDASFATWLYRLVSNACVDILRREGRHQVMAGPSLDDEESSPEPPGPKVLPPMPWRSGQSCGGRLRLGWRRCLPNTGRC